MIEKRKSRSRSLENLDSITEEEQKETVEETKELDLSLSKPDLAVTSYDDACPRAHRMSRLLQDEGLGAQLTDRFSGVGWHKDVVSSVLNVSSVKRAESYKVATELSRVSSMTVQSRARTGSSTPKISSCGHTDTWNSRVDSFRPAENKNSSTSPNQKCSSRSDDDYVKIIYEENGYSLQEERRNSANNVIYSQNPAMRGLDTCNDYVELVEDTPDGGDSNNNRRGQQHRPYRQLSQPESRTHSVQALPKSASSSDMGQYIARRGFFAKKGRMFSEPGIIPLDPETCLLNGVSVSSVCSRGSQRRPSNQSNSSMANRPSSSHMENDHGDDPWVLREDVRTSRSHNCTNIKRSNSCSSIHESTESLAKEQTIKGHRKQPSDTLIFINRNAFRSSPTAISRDRELDRLVARYCTPPRDMGPEDLVQEITECQDRGKVVLRYATPPRSSSTSVDEESTDATVIVNSCVDASAVSNKLATCMTSSNSSPSSMCHSVNTNNKSTSETVPSHMKSCVTDTMLNSQDSSSFHSDGQLSSPGSSTKSPSALSSPSSIVSNESIVDSLRNAVFSITSKFRSSRSVESSPSRSPLVTSPDDTDVEKSPSKGKKSKKTKERKPRKILEPFTRSYSDRIRNRTKIYDKGMIGHESDKNKGSTMVKQLATLLKHTEPEIGARIAATKPIVLGTYTLPRHRPARPKKNTKPATTSAVSDTSSLSVPSTESSSRETTPETFPVPSCSARLKIVEDQNRDSHDSGCMMASKEASITDLMDGQSRLSSLGRDATPSSSLGRDATPPIYVDLPLSGADMVFNSESDVNDDNDTGSDSYYERRLFEDLELNIDEDVFRDSAVYSDDGGVNECSSPNDIIQDTVKLLQHKYHQTKDIPRIEVKKTEKAHGMRNIMKNLEATFTNTQPEGGADDPSSLKTIRDRKRELAECAAMARIRQNSLTVDDSYRSPPSDSGDSLGVSPTTKTGWVKQVVHSWPNTNLECDTDTDNRD